MTDGTPRRRMVAAPEVTVAELLARHAGSPPRVGAPGPRQPNVPRRPPSPPVAPPALRPPVRSPAHLSPHSAEPGGRRHRVDQNPTRASAPPAGLTDAPALPPTRPPAAHPAATPARRGRLIGRIVLAVVSALVLLVSGVGWAAKTWLDGKVRQVSALDPDSDAIQNAAAQQGDQNFLVVGSDSRAGAQPGDDVGSAAQVPGARSDTIMVAHIPADRSRMVVVSFPRDLEITRPACERWDPVSGNYTGEQLPPAPLVKINTAFEGGGPRCVTKTVQQLSGLAVNHFVGVDFQGFKAMVDAVHGVAVCVEHPVRDAVLGTVIDKAGTTTLTGNQALSFVRARHVADDPTSDYGRIQRQQRFLSSLLRTALSGKVLLDPLKLRDFAGAFASATFGENIGVDALLPLAQSLQRLDAAHVTFVTVPTVGVANARGNEVLRAAENHALFTAIIEGKSLPGEARAAGPGPAGSPAQPAAATPPPARGLVVVRNATIKQGMATSVAASLTRLGFTVTSVGNASRQSGYTTISYPADRVAQARELAAAVPTARLQPDDASDGSLSLVIGTDFAGVVPPGGTPVPPTAPPAPSPDAVPPGLSTVNAADATCH